MLETSIGTFNATEFLLVMLGVIALLLFVIMIAALGILQSLNELKDSIDRNAKSKDKITNA